MRGEHGAQESADYQDTTILRSQRNVGAEKTATRRLSSKACFFNLRKFHRVQRMGFVGGPDHGADPNANLRNL